MSEVVNMVKLVAELPKRPRGRACIVLTHDYLGQRDWAAELAKQAEAERFDLLECAAADEALGNSIAAMSVAELFALLHKQSQARVLIVTGLEFLTATWSSLRPMRLWLA